MAHQFDALNETLTQFITAQHIFFCGTAGPDGRVNISPKGMTACACLALTVSYGETSPDRAMKPQGIWRRSTA